MPSCPLVDSSLLLTLTGWSRADEIFGQHQLVGLDRFGRQQIQDVSIGTPSGSIQRCYLGTRAAFGAFHPDTTLIDAEGLRLTIRAILEAPTLDRFGFESVNELGVGSDAGEIYLKIWNDLRKAAINTNSELAIFRCSVHGSALRATCPWAKPLEGKDKAYVAVDGQAFMKELEADAQGTMARALELLFANDTQQVEVERKHHVLILWFASLLRNAGASYRLVFDTIQHSAIIGLDVSQSSIATEQARTSFIGERGETVTIAWAEKQWNPISAGFIVAPA